MRVLKKDIQHLMKLLETTHIPINYDRGRKKTQRHGSHKPAGKGRTVLLGQSPYKNNTLTKFTQSHPDVYAELQKLSRKYAPFPVKSFMLNKDYQTQPHYDRKNTGTSVIFSFGDYTGGELVVENKIIDTFMKTYEMDGSHLLHWNLPITGGTKYSIIFFNAS